MTSLFKVEQHSIVTTHRLGVEMNFHAVTKSLLKQTDPNAIYRVLRISRMIHHPAMAQPEISLEAVAFFAMLKSNQ